MQHVCGVRRSSVAQWTRRRGAGSIVRKIQVGIARLTTYLAPTCGEPWRGGAMRWRGVACLQGEV